MRNLFARARCTIVVIAFVGLCFRVALGVGGRFRADPRSKFERSSASGALQETNHFAAVPIPSKLKMHRCEWAGRPDRLEDYLTSTQLVDPQAYYFGRARSQYYFQHLFVEGECTGGLPRGHCFSGLRRATHCGDDEDWAVISPDETDGPGVMWRNENACLPNEGRDPAANVSVDFLCFDREEQTHLHKCIFESNPAVGGLRVNGGAANPNEEEKILTALMQSGQPGKFQHFWDPTECSNGLPSNEVPCLTSVRWGEHCTGDHDWASIFETGTKRRGASWFTSHSCTCARVAVDYYCPPDPPEGWTFRRCQFSGVGETVVDESCERGHVMRAVADVDPNVLSTSPGDELILRQDDGTCKHHRFRRKECFGGQLPQKKKLDCVASIVQAVECGREQDWEIVGADGTDTPFGVRWFNGNANCTNDIAGSVTVDLLCKEDGARGPKMRNVVKTALG